MKLDDSQSLHVQSEVLIQGLFVGSNTTWDIATCFHRTDTLPEFFIVIFSPDISASCLILSGSFFPQLELSFVGFCGGSDGKESACSSGDPGSILGWRRSPGEGNGYPLQCSCLGNLMNRGAWWAIVHGVARVGHDCGTNISPL